MRPKKRQSQLLLYILFLLKILELEEFPAKREVVFQSGDGQINLAIGQNIPCLDGKTLKVAIKG